MSWFESHRSLKNHRKTKDLAKRLGLTRRDTIGLLNEFWWMCIDHADEDGILKSIAAEDIAAECDWTGNPIQLLESLWQSGFIDPIGDFAADANGNVTADFIVHDWVERRFCYDILTQEIEMRRAKVRARVRKHRSRNVTKNGNVTDIIDDDVTLHEEKESSKEKDVKTLKTLKTLVLLV